MKGCGQVQEIVLTETAFDENKSSHTEFLWREIAVIACAILVQFVGGIFTQLSFIAAILFALTGPRAVIQALTVTWMISFLNIDIFSQLNILASLRWLLLWQPLFKL